MIDATIKHNDRRGDVYKEPGLEKCKEISQLLQQITDFLIKCFKRGGILQN